MVIVDIETTGHAAMLPVLLDGVKAPSNYKDQVKIEQYLAERRAEVANEAAVKIDFNRVVCAAVLDVATGQVESYYAEPNDTDERVLLNWVWSRVADHTVVGFNIRQFDLPVLIRRSQVLGIEDQRQCEV